MDIHPYLHTVCHSRLQHPCIFQRLLILLGLSGCRSSLVACLRMKATCGRWWCRQTGPAGTVESLERPWAFIFQLQPSSPGAPAAGTAPQRAAAQQPAQPGDVISGFRPLYVQRKTPEGDLAEATVLYPIFIYRSYGDYYLWSVFDLINRYGRKEGATPSRIRKARPSTYGPSIFPAGFREFGGIPIRACFRSPGAFRGHFGL